MKHPAGSDTARRSRWRSVVATMGRVIAVVSILWLIYSLVTSVRVAHLSECRWEFVAGAIGCGVMSQLALGLRWHSLSSVRDARLGRLELCHATFCSAASAYTGLGTYVAVAYRYAVLLRSDSYSPREAAFCLLADKVIGLSCMLLSAGAAMVALSQTQQTAWIVALGTLIATAVIGLWWRRASSRSLDGVSSLSQDESGGPPMERPRSKVLIRAAATATAWGMLAQGGAIASMTLVGAALSQTEWGFLQSAVAGAGVEIASFLVPTPAGIGVRELATTKMYTALAAQSDAGAAVAHGVLMAVLCRIVGASSILAGLLLTAALKWYSSIPSHRTGSFRRAARHMEEPPSCETASSQVQHRRSSSVDSDH